MTIKFEAKHQLCSFYGLPEKKQDFQDVSSILQSILINCSPLQCLRFARNANGQKAITVRPLKVILNSEANKEIIIGTAKKLKDIKTFSHIRIARFLNKEEQEKEKATRAYCKKLNVDTGASDIGKKSFIVINGQIMAVQADGKLSRYAKQPSAMTNNNNSKISPSIQNIPVCSQHYLRKHLLNLPTRHVSQKTSWAGT